jgi:hypothetical protein
MRDSARSAQIAEVISANSEKIRELHDRVHETLKERQTPKGRVIWERACADFREAYDGLAFPGGYDRALRNLAQNDSDAIETALVFLELRPYFFRSGYIRSKLRRLLKRAPLSSTQRARLETLVAKEQAWRAGAQQAVQAHVPASRGRRLT